MPAYFRHAAGRIRRRYLRRTSAVFIPICHIIAILLAPPYACCTPFRSAPFRAASGFALLTLVAAPPLHHALRSAALFGRCWSGDACGITQGAQVVGCAPFACAPAAALTAPPMPLFRSGYTPHPPGTLTRSACALSRCVALDTFRTPVLSCLYG